MSQPPQNGWGPGQPDQPYGQPSPNGGYGDYGQAQQGGYGQPSPSEGYGGYGQDPAAAPNFGPSFGNDMPNQGEPPKKSNAKIPILICAGCAVIALIIAILGGGVFLFTRDSGEPAGGGETTTADGETTPEENEPTDDEPAEDEPAEDEPADDEPTEDEPADDGGEQGGEGAGTRDEPYAPGQTFTLPDAEDGEIDVTFGEVDWDAADAILEANEFNEEPADGEVYILVPVTVTYSGPDSVYPMFLLSVSYVAGSGNSYTQASVVTPNDAISVGELYDGGTAEFDVAFAIPEESVQDGAFTVAVMLDFTGDDVWVAAE